MAVWRLGAFFNCDGLHLCHPQLLTGNHTLTTYAAISEKNSHIENTGIPRSDIENSFYPLAPQKILILQLRLYKASFIE